MKKEIVQLSCPIILQSMIVYLVMAVENLLVARISGNAFAALTLTTQVYNITSLVIQGITGGGNILLARYLGSRNYGRVRQIIRYEFIFAVIFVGTVGICCTAVPRTVMSVLTDHEDLIKLGGIYLQVMGITWFLAACSMIMTQVLRTIGEASVPMRMAAVEMGLELIATIVVVSSGFSVERKLFGIAVCFLALRITEFGILSTFLIRKTAEWKQPQENQNVAKDRRFFAAFVRTVFPVTANELMWSLGTSILVMMIGRQSQAVISAYGICTTAGSLAGVVMSGLDLAGSMVLGRNIAVGRKRVAQIQKILRRLSLEGAFLEIGILLGMMALAPYIYGLGEDVNRLGFSLLLIDAGIEMFKARQSMNMTGILRALGDVRFCFLNDILFQWLYIIPGTWLLLQMGSLPFAVVYFFMRSDQVIKVFTSEKRIQVLNRRSEINVEASENS
ncbi:MAG: hypothetical protein LUH19_07865 [Lachnospiraceae bacterium]|nr:hypothetical protein [Lachnospiraceae bacterium]